MARQALARWHAPRAIVVFTGAVAGDISLLEAARPVACASGLRLADPGGYDPAGLALRFASKSASRSIATPASGLPGCSTREPPCEGCAQYRSGEEVWDEKIFVILKVRLVTPFRGDPPRFA